MAKKDIKKDVEFLYGIGSLRNVGRTWEQVIGMPCASVLEHTVRVAFLALLIARMEGEKNEEKILKMALVHDLAEARTGDTNAIHAVYVERDEHKAAHDLFNSTAFSDLNTTLVAEYKERKTKVSQIIKDADNLDCDLELKELEERGSKMRAKNLPNRKLIRNKKLYTKSARRLWDEINTSDPSSWYLGTEKWWRMKDAGR